MSSQSCSFFSQSQCGEKQKEEEVVEEEQEHPPIVANLVCNNESYIRRG